MATPTLADEAILAADAIFIGRVQQALVNNCILIREENVPAPPTGIPAAVIAEFYKKRANFAVQVLSNPTAFAAVIVRSVATDATVIANVTSAGTLVGASQATVDAQQAAATDININNAIFAQFNSYFSPV